MPVEPGLSGEVELTVGDGDTALAMHSGEVAVLATPRTANLAFVFEASSISFRTTTLCTARFMA